MAKKVDPILKASQISEPIASPEGGDAFGESPTSKSGSESSSGSEQPKSPDPGNGDAGGEKHTYSDLSHDDSEAMTEMPMRRAQELGRRIDPDLLKLAVDLAWGEAVDKMRESGLLSRLPQFATSEWFHSLIMKNITGVLR